MQINPYRNQTMKNRLMFATCSTLLLSLIGCGGPPEHITTLGPHPLTIIDTSGGSLGGTSKTDQDDNTGITIHTFESGNGRYKIKLENEVMTLNDVQYTLQSPTDSIRIVDDKIEINGGEAVPDIES